MLKTNLALSLGLSMCLGLAHAQALANGSAIPDVAVTSANNPSVYGDQILLTATVTGDAGTPTGQVRFVSDLGEIPPCGNLPLVGGVANCSFHSYPIGSYQVKVIYGGDANYQEKESASITHVVGGKYGTSVTLSAPAASAIGEPLQLYAQVYPAPGTHVLAPWPSGQVSFSTDAGVPVPGCAGIPLASGSATCTVVPQVTGPLAFKAAYSGDALYAAAESVPLLHTMTGAATSQMQLAFSGSPSQVGRPVTLVATASGTAGVPQGTVSFNEYFYVWSGFPLYFPIPGCTDLPLVDGIAQCTMTPQRARQMEFVAFYSGSATYRDAVAREFHNVANRNASADLDASGASDVIWYHAVSHTLLRMAWFSATPGIIDVQDDAEWRVAGIGDLDGDGRADVVWRNEATGSVYGLLLNGPTIVAEGVIHTEPNLDWRIERVADLDGDGKADLVWRNRATGEVYAMLMNGLSIASAQTIYAEPDQNWKIVAAGDLDGDGKADLLWRHQVSGDVFAMLMNGFTVLGGGVIYSEPNPDWTIVGLADFNNDGRADILWKHRVTGEVFQMQMNGTAISAGQVIYTEPDTLWDIAALGDYDGDGSADMLWRHRGTGQVYLMRMNGFAVAASELVYTEPDLNWRIVGP